jgi:butyrate kinase
VSEKFLILAVNPGSTSTKISLFEGAQELHRRTVRHAPEEIALELPAQKDFRLRAVETFLSETPSPPTRLDAVAARGGLMKAVQSGVYRVGEGMIRDLLSGRYGSHASNLGAVIAVDIGRRNGCGAFIVDPVVVDELDDAARLTGFPEIERRSIFHALNHKSVARQTAGELGKAYEDCNFIVAHMGGGISVGAHRRGRVVDVNNALEGEGPFSAERSGALPAAQVVELCFGGSLSREEVMEKIAGSGGILAHCGTRDLGELRDMARREGGQPARVLEALSLRTSQEICKHGATLEGGVDRIILTGGMARDGSLVNDITSRVSHLAPVKVVPGEREMHSLAASVLRVLRGEEKALEYG